MKNFDRMYFTMKYVPIFQIKKRPKTQTIIEAISKDERNKGKMRQSKEHIFLFKLVPWATQILIAIMFHTILKGTNFGL